MFHSDRSGNLDVWSVSTDGSNLTQLTRNLSANDIFPVWSPDGRAIAFVSNWAGTHNNDIWIMNADGTEPRNLTTDNPFEDNMPSWSSDGSQIVYVARPSRTDDFDIWVMGADGQYAHNLTADFDRHGFRWPVWSYDGKRIAFIDPEPNTPALWIVNLADYSVMALGPVGMGFEVAWSPVEDVIALSMSQDSGLELWLLDAVTQEATNLTAGSGPIPPGAKVVARWTDHHFRRRPRRRNTLDLVGGRR